MSIVRCVRCEQNVDLDYCEIITNNDIPGIVADMYEDGVCFDCLTDKEVKILEKNSTMANLLLAVMSVNATTTEEATKPTEGVNDVFGAIYKAKDPEYPLWEIGDEDNEISTMLPKNKADLLYYILKNWDAQQAKIKEFTEFWRDTKDCIKQHGFKCIVNKMSADEVDFNKCDCGLKLMHDSIDHLLGPEKDTPQ